MVMIISKQFIIDMGLYSRRYMSDSAHKIEPPLYNRRIIFSYLQLIKKNYPDIAAAHHERYDGSGYPKGFGAGRSRLEEELSR